MIQITFSGVSLDDLAAQAGIFIDDISRKGKKAPKAEESEEDDILAEPPPQKKKKVAAEAPVKKRQNKPDPADEDLEIDLGEDEEGPTHDDARAAAKKVVESGNREGIKTLLKKYKVASISDIPKNKIQSYLDDLELL